MSEMIERVARALAKSDGADPDMVLDVDGEPMPVWRATYWHPARAAIEAMREPTERMVGVGEGAFTPDGLTHPVILGWRAMIDEALK